MRLIKNPARKRWSSLLQRPEIDATLLEKKVKKIIDKVKKDGDKAIIRLTKELDNVKLKSLRVTEKEVEEAYAALPDQLKESIRTAKRNIEKFHRESGGGEWSSDSYREMSGSEGSRQTTGGFSWEAGKMNWEVRNVQVGSNNKQIIETMPGVQCWRKSVAIEKVGLYIPGGTAPLFSTVLMLGIPAKIAGCKEIVLCSPPQKDGKLHPAVLFAAKEVGITTIIKAGGAQAIAAMAYGTKSIPQVYKIFGPGNQYVTCAKQLVQSKGIAIDMPAGPSEVCVLADDTADPSYVAADLLSQAEHGPDSQVLLVTTSGALIDAVQEKVQKQLLLLPRRKIAAQALKNSKLILVNTLEEAIDLVNAYAPEHLIISCQNEDAIAERVINAGSVFLGKYSPESVGDYASGTNHALPTNGYAKSYSGVSVDSFIKKITYQRLTLEGLEGIGPSVIDMAIAEGLQAHANAVTIRIQR
jgi:histidinol dehydrogenase